MIIQTIGKLLMAIFLIQSGILFANHESSGREGASTIYLRFSSRGTGIDTDILQGVNALVEAQKKAGTIAEFKIKHWGREGETDLCIRSQDTESTPSWSHRYFLYGAIDRVIRLARPQGEHQVASQISTSKCNSFPESYSGLNLGAFRANDGKNSLECRSTERLPDAYSVRILLAEILQTGEKAEVKYQMLQSSRNARFRPVSGVVDALSVKISPEGQVQFIYEADETFKLIVSYVAQDLYKGTIELGKNQIKTECKSVRN